MKKINLRAFEDKDSQLLATWLISKHVSRWFYHPDHWLEEVASRHDKFSWITHFIVTIDNQAIGFCQYYDCFAAGENEDWYTVLQPNEVFSIDYLIGEPTTLGRGYGKQIVEALTNKIASFETSRQIIVQPEKENVASVKVLVANGYEYDQKSEYFYKNLK